MQSLLAANPAQMEYMKKYTEHPERFARYCIDSFPGTMGRSGSQASEANHSGLVQALGRGSSMPLEDQLCKLADRLAEKFRQSASRKHAYLHKWMHRVRVDGSLDEGDREAMSLLSKRSYESFYIEMVKEPAVNYAFKMREDGTAIVQRRGQSPESAREILAGRRCTCHCPTAYLMQCPHEYCVDGTFVRWKWDPVHFSELTMKLETELMPTLSVIVRHPSSGLLPLPANLPPHGALPANLPPLDETVDDCANNNQHDLSSIASDADNEGLNNNDTEDANSNQGVNPQGNDDSNLEAGAVCTNNIAGQTIAPSRKRSIEEVSHRDNVHRDNGRDNGLPQKIPWNQVQQMCANLAEGVATLDAQTQSRVLTVLTSVADVVRAPRDISAQQRLVQCAQGLIRGNAIPTTDFAAPRHAVPIPAKAAAPGRPRQQRLKNKFEKTHSPGCRFCGEHDRHNVVSCPKKAPYGTHLTQRNATKLASDLKVAISPRPISPDFLRQQDAILEDIGQHTRWIVFNGLYRTCLQASNDEKDVVVKATTLDKFGDVVLEKNFSVEMHLCNGSIRVCQGQHQTRL